MSYTDKSYAYSGHESYQNRRERYHRGAISTPHGFVSVFAAETKFGDEITDLTFIYAGRTYNRRWEKYYSPRYRVTLARRFAMEVVINQEEKR